MNRRLWGLVALAVAVVALLRRRSSDTAPVDD